MKKCLLILALTGCLMSCDDKEEKPIYPNVETYPLSVGTQWTYDRKVVVDHYESENSDKIVATDTFNFVVNVWIDKDTVLNGKEVRMVKAHEDGLNATSINFYFLDSEGLKTYAYLNAGLTVFAQTGVHLKSAVDHSLSEDGWISYENPPTLNVKLPLRPGSKWTYRLPTETNPLQIDKEVTGAETLKLAGQSFNCYKINWTFLNAPQLSVGLGLMNEWISDKGLIQRTITYNKAVFVKEDGQSISYVRSSEILTLKALEIPKD